MQRLPSIRLTRLGWVAVMMLAFLSTACSAITERVGPLPENPYLALLERKAGLIVFIGMDGNVYAIDQGGQNGIPVTENANVQDRQRPARFYQAPAWSPDGTKLAFVEIFVDPEQENPSWSLHAFDIQTLETVQIFQSSSEEIFFAQWAPNNQQIGFLTSTSGSPQLTLQIGSLNGREPVVAGSDQSVFFDWSTDSRQLISHTGGSVDRNPEAQLTLLTVSDGLREQPLTFKPYAFKAPDWSPQGNQILFAAEDFSEGILYSAFADGSRAIELAFFDQDIAFGWSPEATHVAFIEESNIEADNVGAVIGQLNILDMETRTDPLQSLEDDVVAFFWAPDNEQIAYIHFAVPEGEPPPNSIPFFHLSVMNVNSGTTKLLATFRPTADLFNVLPLFDQIQRSATIWSPDSENIVLSVLDPNGQNPLILVVPASGGLEPRLIANGRLAFWSWK